MPPTKNAITEPRFGEPTGIAAPVNAVVPTPVALDVSLEKVRALHRVWRALNDGDCPKCHKHRAATAMDRETIRGIACPDCGFYVTDEEIELIEEAFAPAMDAAVAIFEEWRKDKAISQRIRERVNMDVFLGIVPGERWPR